MVSSHKLTNCPSTLECLALGSYSIPLVQLNYSETIPDFILENILDVSLRILKGARCSVCSYAASHSPLSRLLGVRSYNSVQQLRLVKGVKKHWLFWGHRKSVHIPTPSTCLNPLKLNFPVFSPAFPSSCLAERSSSRATSDVSSNRQLCYWLLTLRRLMSYIYGAPILYVSRSHTTTQHSR